MLLLVLHLTLLFPLLLLMLLSLLLLVLPVLLMLPLLMLLVLLSVTQLLVLFTVQLVSMLLFHVWWNSLVRLQLLILLLLMLLSKAYPSVFQLLQLRFLGNMPRDELFKLICICGQISTGLPYCVDNTAPRDDVIHFLLFAKPCGIVHFVANSTLK
jgi:hypothetical protein